MSRAACPSVDGYEFLKGKNVPSDKNLGRSSSRVVEELAQECNDNPECISFNTDGWLKWSGEPIRDWTTSNSCAGVYIKITSK